MQAEKNLRKVLLSAVCYFKYSFFFQRITSLINNHNRFHKATNEQRNSRRENSVRKKCRFPKQRKMILIVTINKLPLVSIDFNHNSSSSIFDVTQTQVIKNNFCRVLSWYDNEWGFSNRMIDTLINLKKLL